MTTIVDFLTGKRHALVEPDPAASGHARAVYDRLLERGREPVLVPAAPRVSSTLRGRNGRTGYRGEGESPAGA